MKNKTILFFGATGSLGNEFIKRNINDNIIVNFSRDECKHWKLELKFKKHKDNIKNIMGDIRDKNRVKKYIKIIKPNIIIIASALKHIERCEYATSECINTNLIGIKNVLDSIEELEDIIKCESVIFISTDKACSPVNLYGMCKAISEKMVIEKSLTSKFIKYNIVRYGNVLNSRGSIIPLLHHMGNSKDYNNFTLTDKRMTRFIMTLESSCKLIEYAIINGENGEIIIPQIKSMKILDLFEIFSELYSKNIVVKGIRPGEKLYELLINGTEYMLTYIKNNYYHILPNYLNKICSDEQLNISSNDNIISKNKLKEYLENLKLLSKNKIYLEFIN